MNKLIAFVLMLMAHTAAAQELNCRVMVNDSRIVGMNKQVFSDMQRNIAEFINTTKWTTDAFKNQERIDCQMNIVINQASSNEYEASIQVQYTRPVYKSNYTTTLFNYNDEDFRFQYTEFQQLQFNENTFTDNLTSVLAFYAYLILGLDYDSYSALGGTPYFNKAQNIVNNAQGAVTAYSGWNAQGSLINRYWIMNNLTNSAYTPLRQAVYDYHRQGLDLMHNDTQRGREGIIKALKSVQRVQRERPGSAFQRIFMSGKADELVGMYTKALPFEKGQILPILNEIDPSNSLKYGRIMQ
jgi:hypothetical protein